MISDFTEKEIRKAILSKINPKITSKKSKHWKGSIYLGDKLISKVKIPNDHIRVMKEKKSKYIADSLRLEPSQFNEFVKCTLRGPEYYRIQSEIEESSQA